MQLSEALERIEAIHAHVARGEAYRGYHPQALAVSGAIGLLGAVAQQLVAQPSGALAFVCYWSLIAALAALAAGVPTLLDFLYRDGPVARRQTGTVWRQFLPCLLAGLAMTVAVARPEYRDECVALLPGAWALLYGLGTVAALPYLPRLAGAVAAWYLVGGAVLLWVVEGPVPAGWSVGVPFGLGQLMAAWVLHADRQREPHDGR